MKNPSAGKFLRKLAPYVLIAIAFFAFRSWYFSNNFEEGEQAADFSTRLVDGSSFSLSDLRGSYVLLDFWGSWCGPCREKAPAMRALHQQAGDRLAIVSVAIEKSADSWKEAIERDQRSWPHHIMDKTSNLRFLDGPISNLYGVNQVPTHFLINPQGQIVGVDMSWRQIVAEID